MNEFISALFNFDDSTIDLFFWHYTLQYISCYTPKFFSFALEVTSLFFLLIITILILTAMDFFVIS